MISSSMERFIITGANSGIGKGIAPKLALRKETQKIYLACRNPEKAEIAKRDLEQSTGRSIFETLEFDVSSPQSARTIVDKLPQIDALVMNAGGLGRTNPAARTKAGVTRVYAKNIQSHVTLLESLIASKKLKKTAVLLSSEVARGVPLIGIKRPNFPTSSVDDFEGVINGKIYAKKSNDPVLAYGDVKYIGALWMASLARANPHLRFLTVSPGLTMSTNVTKNLPIITRILMNHFFLPHIGPMMGLAHSLDYGSERVLQALTDETLESGRFYASKQYQLSGPIVDQATIFADLNNHILQDRAAEAVRRYA